MHQTFRKRLKAGERLVGTILTLPSPEVAEIMSKCGFDWLFIDGEHSPLDTLQCQRMIQATANRCACIVRVPIGDEKHIKQALDIGAAGVIVPQVNSAEHARKIVDCCRYPPVGCRGVGLARAHGYGLDFAEYMESANDEIAVVVQAEHIDGVNNIEDIVAVDGVDAVFIGPYDLSASMGKTGEVSAPDVLQAIDRVIAACRKADVQVGYFAVSAEGVKPYIDKGFTLLASATDALYLTQTASEAVQLLRE